VERQRGSAQEARAPAPVELSQDSEAPLTESALHGSPRPRLLHKACLLDSCTISSTQRMWPPSPVGLPYKPQPPPLLDEHSSHKRKAHPEKLPHCSVWVQSRSASAEAGAQAQKRRQEETPKQELLCRGFCLTTHRAQGALRKEQGTALRAQGPGLKAQGPGHRRGHRTRHRAAQGLPGTWGCEGRDPLGN